MFSVHTVPFSGPTALAFRRIHLIGSTGSGKSHLAALLSRRLNIPAYDLDDIFWRRDASFYGARTEATERDEQLKSIVRQDAWIIEGVYHNWLGPSFERAEIIVVLTPHVLLRDLRIVRRFILRKLGIVLSKRETIRDLWKLLRWNHSYDTDNYPRAMAYVKERGKQVVVCKSARDAIAAIGLRDGTAKLV